MQNIISKITLKKIGAQPASQSIKPEHGKVVLAHVYGVAKDQAVKASNFDQEYTVFSGNFEAINCATGEVYNAGQLIMPTIVQNLLTGAVAGLKPEQDGVQFAFEISAKHSDKGSTGYEYTARPLMEQAANDPLAQLRETVKLALPAPKAEAAKAKK